MKLSVYSSKGSKTKKSVDLDDAVFGIEPNDHAIYLDVKRFLAAQRQVPHVPAASRIRCSAAVVPCLVLSHAITPRS